LEISLFFFAFICTSRSQQEAVSLILQWARSASYCGSDWLLSKYSTTECELYISAPVWYHITPRCLLLSQQH